MSTFLGLVEEIPGISIDRFDMKNLNSSVFFLSHCHTDHMIGLSYSFFEELSRKNNSFYCSHISKAYLKSIYSTFDPSFIDKYLQELPLNESRIIDYKYDNNHMSMSVTCISAGHCPGSIMFLFTFKGKRILYTGDFRINKEDFSKLKPLHITNTKPYVPLHIDKIYLDTTFLNLDYLTFPSRSDSSKKLCSIVKDWLEKDFRNIVILEISANLGSEFIYIELSKFLNKKIHVKRNMYDLYSRIEILANCITDASESTSIHACMEKMDSISNTRGLICQPDVDQKYILTIVISAMKWAKKDTSNIIEQDKKRKQTMNICYSTHASFDELKNFVQYFKPNELFACVCPESNKKDIFDLLKNIMLKTRNSELSTKSRETNSVEFSKHNTFKTNNDFKSQFLSDDESS